MEMDAPAVMNASDLLNFTVVDEDVYATGHEDVRQAQRGSASPASALFICLPLLLLLCRYRQALMPFLRWSRSFPLRRHLGGRGHYVSVSQTDLVALNT